MLKHAHCPNELYHQAPTRWTILAWYIRHKKQGRDVLLSANAWKTFLTLCAVCCRVTVEAVVVGRDVTCHIKTRALVVFRATFILDAPFEICAKKIVVVAYQPQSSQW